MGRIRFRTKVASVVAGLAAALLYTTPIAHAASSPASAEAAFQQARGYTVRVRVRVETPFLGDDQGAWTGAGFLVDSERGWIVTNAHVAGQSPSEVEIAFADEEFQPVRKLYVDSFADIAVLSLDRVVIGRRAASLDRTAPPIVGESVGAYGHPLGVPYTGTRGIVSGYTDQIGPDLIQIDATVDPGNSGGPVIALGDGRILGIATAGMGGDKSKRMNFATPIDDVQRVLALLRRGITPNPPKLALSLLKDEDGRHTMQVACSFDSTRWPLLQGDRIVSIEGERAPVKRLNDLVRALRGRTGSVALVVERDGRRVSVVAQVTSRQSILERRGISIDGALIAPMEIEDVPAASSTSLMVHSVDPSSDAASLELEQLDILHSVDDRPFSDLESLIAYLQERPRGPIILVVRRTSDDLYRFYDYHRRELPGEDIQIVKPESSSEVAEKP